MTSVPNVHSLLRLSDTSAIRFEQPAQDWVLSQLTGDPWVVVRRPAPIHNWYAAGVRGARRSQRCAIWVRQEVIAQVTTPVDLVATEAWRAHPRSRAIPAIGALAQIACIMRRHVPRLHWGPTGSIGLELASGEEWATASSDLDLILLAGQPIGRSVGAALYRDLAEQTVRVDLLVETPVGALALADWATHPAPWLLRTRNGPRLVADAWSWAPKSEIA
jgi:phosphoribosyl-dephospho-CoA transferase